jgi:hypothetical protein
MLVFMEPHWTKYNYDHKHVEVRAMSPFPKRKNYYDNSPTSAQKDEDVIQYKHNVHIKHNTNLYHAS